MRALNLDYGHRRSAGRRLGWTILLLGTLAAAFAARAYLDLSAELGYWEDTRQGLRATSRRREPAVVPADRDKLNAELKAANQVLDRLATPWDALFRAVEQSVDGSVVLLSFEPDVERAALRLSAEAKDASAMLDYLRRLQTHPPFAGAHAIAHQVQTQDPQKPVRFQLSARWDPAAPSGPVDAFDP